MIVEFGSFCLILALCLSVFQVAASLAGYRRPVLAQAGEGAAMATALCVAASFLALMHAFVVSDFSVANVAANSHMLKPMLYKVAATWGSHEGSMLLWCLVLTGYGAAVAGFRGNLPRTLKSRVLMSQGALGVLFLTYTLFASNPFARLSPVPVEGQSLNPLLQDPALAFHPPFLYAGYVGFSVVFSFALAALIEGRVDQVWARWVRPWTLAAWSLLTIGITLGAFWAYYELGWGGWWFWDPVENASFMPWLAGTALLHSAIVTERRGALTGWTVFLAILAFTFAMLGAFLVRSGVLTSVHAFAVDPRRGILLLIILGLVAGTGFGLFGWRAPNLAKGGTFMAVSRESALVLNNILLTAATSTVLLGTLYPLLRQVLDGQAVSVGAPYFDMTFAPILIITLIVLPLGPLLAWKRAALSPVLTRLRIAAVVAVVGGLAVYAMVLPRHGMAALSSALGLWIIVGTLIALIGRLGTGAPGDRLGRLMRLPLGAWGMTLAHLGLGLFAIGAGCETAWRLEAAQVLAPGQSVALGSYVVSLKDVGGDDGPNYVAEQAVITIQDRAGRLVCDARPERRLYMPGGQSTSEVAICPRGLDQFYVVLGERRSDPVSGTGWLVRAYLNPFVHLILAGPLIMALGGLLSLLDRRLRIAPLAVRPVAQASAGQI
jgi:cytochrome c-type biogenesis protein CcmF